jgi:hypothetical protein
LQQVREETAVLLAQRRQEALLAVKDADRGDLGLCPIGVAVIRNAWRCRMPAPFGRPLVSRLPMMSPAMQLMALSRS